MRKINKEQIKYSRHDNNYIFIARDRCESEAVVCSNAPGSSGVCSSHQLFPTTKKMYYM
jgi:hypothetical protein